MRYLLITWGDRTQSIYNADEADDYLKSDHYERNRHYISTRWIDENSVEFKSTIQVSVR